MIFTGANDLFSGGADINDFSTEPTPETKTIRDVIAAIERGKKTYVAAIDGTAMGGGLELSLACDYRIATARSKVGLPEIKLGLFPGGGGTQRLPRLIGAQAAMEMMLKGETVKAEDAKKKGILDEVVESNVVDAAISLACRALEKEPKRRVSERQAQLGIPGLGLNALPFIAAQAHKMVPKEENGGFAAHKLVDAVEAAVELPFARGIAREERLFEELVRSAPSAALRHIFFAERELSKDPGLAPAEPLEIKKAGVVGGGLMGTGIAITFANAGIPVTVIEPNEAATEKGKQMVFGMYMHQVQKGRMTQEEAWKRGQSVVFTDDYNELTDADVVIEAVFENMDVKKQVFQKLDAICKPEAILASNTSTLDIDEMAAVTKRPDKFVGLHFFAPANIMKLLEIVRGKETSAQTLATAIKLGKTLAQGRRRLGQRVRLHRQPHAVRLCARSDGAGRRGRRAPPHRQGHEEISALRWARSRCSISRASTCSGTFSRRVPIPTAAATSSTACTRRSASARRAAKASTNTRRAIASRFATGMPKRLIAEEAAKGRHQAARSDGCGDHQAARVRAHQRRRELVARRSCAAARRHRHRLHLRLRFPAASRRTDVVRG